MTGKIIKGIGGFYYVACDEKIYTCRAKGIFRKDNIKPLIGDKVEIDVIDDEKLEGSVSAILDRKSSLIRPAIANIDKLFLTVAAKSPDPDTYLIDKYFISIEMQNMPAGIIINKKDLAPEKAEELDCIYRKAGYEVYQLSAKTGEGIAEFKESIRGQSIALGGPSGVGKSSIINLLCPDAGMETGEISRKIERGKHTTRHSEFFICDTDTYVCDTPGFTSVMTDSLKPWEVRMYMPDIISFEGKCSYSDCNHISEPGCLVKEAALSGALSQSRYDSYVKLYNDAKENGYR